MLLWVCFFDARVCVCVCERVCDLVFVRDRSLFLSVFVTTCLSATLCLSVSVSLTYVCFALRLCLFSIYSHVKNDTRTSVPHSNLLLLKARSALVCLVVQECMIASSFQSREDDVPPTRTPPQNLPSSLQLWLGADMQELCALLYLSVTSVRRVLLCRLREQ